MELSDLTNWVQKITEKNLQYVQDGVKVFIDGRELKSAELVIDTEGNEKVMLKSKYESTIPLPFGADGTILSKGKWDFCNQKEE